MQTGQNSGVRAAAGAVWLALVALTVASWTDSTLGTGRTVVAAVVIGLSAIKVVLVVGYYMEVAAAPRWLQALCCLWIVLVFTVIGVGYLVPR